MWRKQTPLCNGSFAWQHVRMSKHATSTVLVQAGAACKGSRQCDHVMHGDQLTYTAVSEAEAF